MGNVGIAGCIKCDKKFPAEFELQPGEGDNTGKAVTACKKCAPTLDTSDIDFLLVEFDGPPL